MSSLPRPASDGQGDVPVIFPACVTALCPAPPRPGLGDPGVYGPTGPDLGPADPDDAHDHTPEDEAYHEGLCLGLEMVPAVPPAGYSRSSRLAWQDGYNAGHDEAAHEVQAGHQDWLDAHEADGCGDGPGPDAYANDWEGGGR